MNICICDDDINILSELNSLIQPLSTSSTQFCVSTFQSAEDLLKLYPQKQTFDIFFLDVEMEGFNGLQLAQTIRSIDSKAIIIFISNHPQYVFNTFQFDTLHYILKPINQLEFENVFKRAILKYKANNATLCLKWQSERYVLNISEITYVEGYKRHITVYTKNNGSFESLGRINDFLKILEPHGFILVHQGFIVNMNYIKRFDVSDVVLINDVKVMTSVRKRSKALKAFDIYLEKGKW